MARPRLFSKLVLTYFRIAVGTVFQASYYNSKSNRKLHFEGKIKNLGNNRNPHSVAIMANICRFQLSRTFYCPAFSNVGTVNNRTLCLCVLSKAVTLIRIVSK